MGKNFLLKLMERISKRKCVVIDLCAYITCYHSCPTAKFVMAY